MLVNHLRHGVAEQHDVLVKGFDLALQFDAIDQVNRHGNVFPAKLVQERVLQELAFVIAHDMLRVQKKLMRRAPYHSPAPRTRLRAGVLTP
ncbi:hypothetical protein FQZ97_982540 [compost metagenome]